MKKLSGVVVCVFHPIFVLESLKGIKQGGAM